MVYKTPKSATLLILFCLVITGCGSISEDANPPTGSAVGLGVGAALGLGTAAVLGAPKPIIGLAGLGGAGLGYYLTTLRFASSGIVKIGGKVYTVGDFVTIDIPTNQLFEANTADFLPGTQPVLDSIVRVLKRYPYHNIIISGNTSGFGTRRDEQKLSENRATQIAAYLWANGISQSSNSDMDRVNSQRTLIYVGYGDAAPIASNLHLSGISANSRIQIVASPSQAALHWNRCKKCFKRFDNIGSFDNDASPRANHPTNYAEAFPDDHLPDNADTSKPTDIQDAFKDSSPTTPTQNGEAPPPENNQGYTANVKGENTDDGAFANYNNVVASVPHTSAGTSVGKHLGYKGETESAGESPG